MDGQSAPKIRLVLNRATLPPPQQQQQQSYEYDEMSSPAQASQLTTGIKLKINPAAIHLKKRRKPAPRYANNPPTAEEMEIEPYPVEDHVIFRMPPNDPLTPRLREIIQQRLPFPPDLSIEWRDSRRGLLKWGEEVLLAKLVDLPCIIESQKTFDRFVVLNLTN
jgi:transcription initiation factor TFIID subunit 7